MLKKISFAMAAILISGVFVACGPSAKPKVLTDYEAMRQDSKAAHVNQVAPEEFKKSTDLYNRAIEAWQDGEEKETNNYAELATMQFKTAQFKAEGVDAEKSITKNKQEIKLLGEQIKSLQKERTSLTKSIDLMMQNIAQSSSASAEQHIMLAQTEREKAFNMGAKELASEDFTKAEAMLKEAEKIVKTNGPEAIKISDGARQLFIKAGEIARPTYEKKLGFAKTAEKQSALLKEVQSAAGPQYAMINQDGVVMILAQAFERNKSELDEVKMHSLDGVVEIAKKYPSTTIIIEGYTQAKSRNAISLSQARANVVRDYLLTRGVDVKRMVTTGKGKENARYDNRDREERSKNDRVEIIFVM